MVIEASWPQLNTKKKRRISPQTDKFYNDVRNFRTSFRMVPGHAKLRAFDKEGQLVSQCIMTKSHLSIGRMVAGPIDELPISNSDSQAFKVPAVLSGVSREHASISWNEKDMAFQILITGRNGALINRKRLNLVTAIR